MDYVDAKNQLSSISNPTIEQIRSIVNRVDATIPHTNSNTTYILYSGLVERGTDNISFTNAEAERLSKEALVRHVGESGPAILLKDKDFEAIVRGAVRRELLGDVKLAEISEPARSEAVVKLTARLNEVLSGKDTAGNRVSADSLWDIASRKYVEENHGNWRIVMGDSIDPKGVLMATELPALLNKPGEFLIDGEPRSALLIGDTPPGGHAAARPDAGARPNSIAQQTERAVARAIVHSAAARTLPNSPLGLPSMTTHKAMEILSAPTHASSRAIAQKALSRLGIAGNIFGLLFAIKDANAAYAEGDTAKGNAILQDWLADFLGGAVGGLAAGQAMAVLLAGLAVTPAGFIAMGTVTFLFGVLGSFAGSTYAQSILDELRGLFITAEQTRSPLALDLDGDGVSTLARDASGVHFDHDANGFAELSGWVAPRDALLVRDLDGNGRIDSGAELFGDHTKLNSGARAANGFAALSELDLDKNGSVDLTEAERAGLRLWRDLDTRPTAVSPACKDRRLRAANDAITKPRISPRLFCLTREFMPSDAAMRGGSCFRRTRRRLFHC